MWLVYCSLPDCCEVGLSHPLATGVRARTTEGKRLRPPLQAVLPAVRLLTAWYDCSLRQLIVYTYTTQSFHANCTRAMHPRPVGAHVSVQEKRVKCVLRSAYLTYSTALGCSQRVDLDLPHAAETVAPRGMVHGENLANVRDCMHVS